MAVDDTQHAQWLQQTFAPGEIENEEALLSAAMQVCCSVLQCVAVGCSVLQCASALVSAGMCPH